MLDTEALIKFLDLEYLFYFSHKGMLKHIMNRKLNTSYSHVQNKLRWIWENKRCQQINVMQLSEAAHSGGLS